MGDKLKAIPANLKNSAWSVLDAAVYPVIYMAMVPVMMKGMGLAVFGLWIVLNTLMTTLQLFNLNMGLTTIRQLSAHAARGDNDQVNLTLSAILRITVLLFLGVLAIGLLISGVLPYWNFLGITREVAGNITLCILLCAFITGTKYLDQVFQSILKAYELYKPAAILNLCSRLGLLGVVVFFALQGSSITSLLLANIIFTGLYLAVHFAVIKTLLPSLHVSLVKGRSLSRSVLSFSLWPWLQVIIVVLAFQTDRFWVSAYAGLKEVSSYGLVATMFNHIHMIFAAMAAWILPRISGMVALGGDPERIYSEVRGLLFGVVTLSLIVFNYVAPALFTFWVGPETYGHMSLYIRSFTVFELLFAHTIMPFYYLNAAGKEKQATWITLFYSLGCYLFMVAGLEISGKPLYMVYGMNISLCVSMPVVNYLVKKQLSGKGSVRTALTEMLPAYLTILLIYLPQLWMSVLVFPFVMFLVYQYYLSPFLQRRLWKQQVRL